MYPTIRVIIDCSELFIETPSSFRSQGATYSSYKHHNTAKGLVGISPLGAVAFVSDLYSGRSKGVSLNITPFLRDKEHFSIEKETAA